MITFKFDFMRTFDSMREWDKIEVWIYDNLNCIAVLFYQDSRAYVLCNSYGGVYTGITDIRRIINGEQEVWLAILVYSKPVHAQIKRIETISELKELIERQLTLALL